MLYCPSTLYIHLWLSIVISTVRVKINRMVALESIMTSVWLIDVNRQLGISVLKDQKSTCVSSLAVAV